MWDAFNWIKAEGVSDSRRYAMWIVSILALLYLGNKDKIYAPLTIDEYTAKIATFPQIPVYYFHRGLLYKKSGEYEKAKADFLQSIYYGMNNSEVKFNLAMSLYEIGNFEQAIGYLNRTVHEEKYKQASFGALCTSYLKLKDYPSAVNCLGTALLTYPANYTFYIDRSQAYSGIREHVKAAEDAQAAVRIATKQYFVHYNSGLILYASGNYSDSINALNTSLQMNPKNGYAYLARADAYSMIGNYSKAISEYDKALRVDPSLYAAQIGLSRAKSAIRTNN